MAVVYPTALKTTRMTSVRDAIDAGAAAGRLEIGTAAMGSILATITLGDPSGTITSGVLTLSGFPRSDTSADNTGTAAAARIRDSNNADVVTGLTVGTSAADIVLDSLSITAGQTVTISSASIHPWLRLDPWHSYGRLPGGNWPTRLTSTSMRTTPRW